MEDFEELFNEENEIETIKRDAEMEVILYNLKLKLANENYDRLVENGIDIESMRNNNMELEAIKQTLEEMLELFIEREEYEKCSKLRDLLYKF